MKYILTLLFASTIALMVTGQEDTKMMKDQLPYYQIPDQPDTYTAANVIARMVDGLGYRYYWATEGLRPEDLAYEPGNDGKSCNEVLEHVAGLSNFILTSVHQEVSGTRKMPEGMSWTEMRAFTLNNFKEVSDLLRETGDVENMKIVFQRKDQTSEFPFWNVINGPMSDAIYHAGQIVSYRRTTGNPSNPNVSVLTGKTRE